MANMKELTEKYHEIEKNFLAKSRREQIMILCAALVVAIFPLYMYFADPAMVKIKKAKAQQISIRDDITNLQNEKNTLMIQLQQDPTVELSRQKEEFREKIRNLDKDLNKQTVDLIPAYEMASVLKDVLSNTNGLRLLSMSNEKPKILVEGGKGGVALYRHETRIVLEGSYLSALSYLQMLENLNKKFIWGPLSYEVKEYPKGIVEIHVYTLSANKDFIRG